jgi:CheY-like chemotaxis protein
VALTGWAQAYDRQRTAEAGFDAHLVKPVSEFELFQTIAAARSADSPAI